TAGTATLALNACRRQCRFAADDGDELIAEQVDLLGDGVEERRPARGRQVAVWQEGSGGRLRRVVHLFQGRLVEAVGQRLGGGRVDALQHDRTCRATGASDVVVTEDGWHIDLMIGGRATAIG